MANFLIGFPLGILFAGLAFSPLVILDVLDHRQYYRSVEKARQVK